MIRNITVIIKILLLISVLLPASISAQYGFLPVKDSTATCSWFNFNYAFSENPGTAKQLLEVFFIVEKMPEPEITVEEMAEYLESVVRFTNREKTFTQDVWLQCVVNCKGMAGDFQIIQCEPELHNIGCQVLQTFKEKFTEWEPGIQRGKAVDVIIGLRVSVHQGKFYISCA